MYWRVVHFLDEDTVEAVPDQWLCSDKQCFWPSLNNTKLKAAIAGGTQPDADWPKYPIRIIGGIYNDLSKARCKAVQAETTSDLNSDVEGKRKIKKKKRFIYNSSESDDESAMEIGFTPKRTLPSISNTSVLSSQSAINDGNVTHTDIAIANNFSELGENAINNISETNIPINRYLHSLSPAIANSGRSTPNKAISTLSEENFKQLVRTLSIINVKLDQISEDVNFLLSKSNNENNTEGREVTVMSKFKLPINSTEDLHEMEEFLSVEDNARQFVYELSKIGGCNVKTMTKRVMVKLLTNSMAMKYSWIGFKQKNNFSILKISSAIMDAVQKIHTKTTCAEVEQAIKMWLVKAKERERKENNQ